MAWLWHEHKRPLDEVRKLTPAQLLAVVFHPRGPDHQLDLTAGRAGTAVDVAEQVRLRHRRLSLPPYDRRQGG